LAIKNPKNGKCFENPLHIFGYLLEQWDCAQADEAKFGY
jgi:hypothetical protein